MQIGRFGRFCTKLLTDRQTDKQRRLHILLGVGNKAFTACNSPKYADVPCKRSTSFGMWCHL